MLLNLFLYCLENGVRKMSNYLSIYCEHFYDKFLKRRNTREPTRDTLASNSETSLATLLHYTEKIAISILVSQLSAKFWKTFYIRFRATLNHQKIELCDSELFIIIFVKLCIKIDLDIACCSSGGEMWSLSTFIKLRTHTESIWVF